MLFWILGYVAVATAIILWDAYIGFGFEFPPIEDGPNAVCAGLFWPIGLPIILVIAFSKSIDSVKTRRLEKANEQRRIRIAAENERDKILEQIEKEIAHVEAEGDNATEHARILPGSSSSYVKS
jgi:hypothetical protein